MTHEEVLARNKSINVALLNRNLYLCGIKRPPIDPSAERRNCYGHILPKIPENHEQDSAQCAVETKQDQYIDVNENNLSMVKLSSWLTSVRADYYQSSEEILRLCFDMDNPKKSDQMAVCEMLKSLGYQKVRLTLNSRRGYYWKLSEGF